MGLFDIFTYIGIIASAVSGALLGVKKRLDFFGIIVLGISTALGGGIIRDMLIGYLPPTALRRPVFTIVAMAVAFLVMIFPRKFTGSKVKFILFFDAIGLGVYTAIGANIAFQQPVTSNFIAIAIGVITGVGGGVIRDIFAQEIPLIFKREIYATASIIGAASLVVSRHFIGGMIPLYICFFTTVIIRLLALYFGINQPEPANAGLQTEAPLG
ncbi:MAG: trimeric intracellular cation channel family protein [Acidobacteriota bacterium]